MELNHLKYFYSVVRERSFTRASRTLRIQQPTISKMVQSLEAELGLTLLERRRDGVHPTAAGTSIFRICEDIFGRVDEIHALTNSKKTECSGPFGFGATDSIASYLVPVILGKYLKRHPLVRPSLFSGSSNLIWHEIQEGKIEFGLVFTAPDEAGFQITEIAKIPFELVISTAQLNNKAVKNSFILSRDIDYPKARPFPVLEMLKRNQIKVETFISSNNLDTQKELVKQGLGISLLPRFMVKEGLERGSLTAIYPKKEFSYSLKCGVRRGKVLSLNAETFLETFRQNLEALI